MATEKKFKATIEIGGAVAGSLKSSFAAVTGNTKVLGTALAGMRSRMKEVSAAMKASGADTAKLGQELATLERKAASTKKVMESWGKIKPIGDNFKSVATRAAGGFVAIGAAAAAASAGVWKLGTAFGNFADSAAEGAATLGTDANFLLSVRYAASQVGASAEMADKALSEMNIRMVEAGEDGNKTGDALRELGLDVGKLQKMDTASQFATISQAFSKYSGSVNKAKLATDLFGKAGRKIPNLLNLGKDGLQQYAQAAKDAGYLLSNTDMAMGDAFDEAMGQFNLALEGSRNIIGRELLPVLTELVTSLGGFIRENAPNIKAVAQEFGGWLKTNGPIIGGQIRDMAKSLVEMGKAAWPFIESVGGVKAVLVGIAAVAFAPAIAAVASLGVSILTAIPAIISLTTGLWGMAAAAAGGSAALLPIIGTVALVAAGIAALGFAVNHVIQNWDTYSWAIKEAWTATTEFVSGMETAISEWVTNTNIAVANLGTSIYDSIAGAFDSLTAKIGEWFSWVFGKFASLGSAIKNVFTGGGGDTPAPVDGARASGGPVTGGKRYLVGERGPEIFSPSSSGSIIPNHRAGGSVRNDNRTITFNIQASPGMNERTLADLVLARLDGRQAALASGALYD